MRHPHRFRRPLLIAAVAVVLLGSCSDGSDADRSSATTAATSTTGAATTTSAAAGSEIADVFPGTTWEVDDPADHGIDAATLQQIHDYAFAPERHTQGLVIVHRGAIVAEWYADGADADSWAASWSVGKSFASAAIGIAVGEGKIPSLDEPMTTWYPDWATHGKGAITLRDVLEMEPGLAWNEDYDPANGVSDIVQMVAAEPDQLAYAESRPKEVEPGTEFDYSSGTAMLLSGVLQQATGMRADQYAKEKIFDPIGMTKVDWWQDAAGHTLTYCCLDTTTRDFARFGLLYLHGGRWGDRQVVPADYVEDSLAGAPNSPDLYGLQWWLDDPEGVPADHFSAVGHDGQYIDVIPSLDLVVVRNSTYVKDPGPSVADPNLFSKYPSDDLIPGKGTIPPDDWDESKTLAPLVADLTD